MSKVDEQWAFLKDLGQLISFCEANNFIITQGEAFRTIEQQQIYVQKGLSKTLKSRHLERMAQDLNLIIQGRLATTKEEYLPLGEYWESLDKKNTWGGRWGWDANHFERSEQERV